MDNLQLLAEAAVATFRLSGHTTNLSMSSDFYQYDDQSYHGGVARTTSQDCRQHPYPVRRSESISSQSDFLEDRENRAPNYGEPVQTHSLAVSRPFGSAGAGGGPATASFESQRRPLNPLVTNIPSTLPPPVPFVTGGQNPLSGTLEAIFNKYELSTDDRALVHTALKGSMTEQNGHLFAAILKLVEGHAKLLTQVGVIASELQDIRKLVDVHWTLPEPTKAAIKQLIAHYLIFPAETYNTLGQRTEDYIGRNPSKFHLAGLYPQSHVVKNIVVTFIRSQVTELRSAWHKKVHESNDKSKGSTLEPFARASLEKYHMGQHIVQIPEVRMAFFALFRQVDRNSGGKKSGKNDTGFWAEIETKLADLHKAHGKDRGSDGWKGWAQTIIKSENGTPDSDSTLTTAPPLPAHAPRQDDPDIDLRPATSSNVQDPPTFEGDPE